jgi:hypothetical protein
MGHIGLYAKEAVALCARDASGLSSRHLRLTPGEIKPAAALWAKELIHEQKLHDTIGLAFSHVFDYALTLVYTTHACKGGRSAAYISANGDVFPCTTCVGASMFRAGSVKTSSFMEIWETSLRQFRQLTSWDSFPGGSARWVLRDEARVAIGSRELMAVARRDGAGRRVAPWRADAGTWTDRGGRPAAGAICLPARVPPVPDSEGIERRPPKAVRAPPAVGSGSM